jgi:hypothetical protein
MLDRLVGFETEYALRFQPAVPGGERTANAVLYARLEAAVRERLPTVPAQSPMLGRFLANGGALHFEPNHVVIEASLSQRLSCSLLTGSISTSSCGQAGPIFSGLRSAVQLLADRPNPS